MAKKKQTKKIKRYRRHKRIRGKVLGTLKKPRLCVFRSSRHIYAQLIDDENGKTIVSVSDSELKKTKLKSRKNEEMQGKTATAFEVGKMIAKKAKNLPAGKQVEKVVFDRGGYKYHGRVKAVADGAREGGLKF